jgi:hypothetical protein
VGKAVPLKVMELQDMDDILNIERNYENYNVSVHRTRGFLSHKRSSAQGVGNFLEISKVRLPGEFGKN